MDKNHERIAALLSQFLQGNINDEEMAELEKWQEVYPEIREWIENPDRKNAEVRQRYDHFISKNRLADWDKIRARMQPVRTPSRNRWWLAAAAVAVVMISAALWWSKRPAHHSASEMVARQQSDTVSPGTGMAYLTLSDGETVRLGEEKHQTIKEGPLELHTSDNTLDYENVHAADVYQHVLTVPPGGTYSIRLADGTQVWLNADSKLIFPSAFPGDERVVTLQGEGFFQVAKDPSKPFRVQAATTTVEALGTAFNINTHLIEGRVKTILTEGKIRVADGGRKHTITEGYATISGNGSIQTEVADPEEALAWKDGYFYFTGKNLREILEDVARWYNVALRIERPVSSDKYKGGIKRTESIEAVCKMIEALTGTHPYVENRTLILK